MSREEIRSFIERVEARLRVRDGYGPLARVLDDALAFAQSGKGHERHASDGEHWTEQPIFEIPRSLGEHGPGFSAGQYAKKMAECMRLPHEARRRELLGAICYAAALVGLFDEEDGKRP